VFYKLSHLNEKKRKKNEETNFSKVYISETPGAIYLKCEVMTLAGISKKTFGFVKVSRSYVYVKISLLYVFFLLITHGCGVPASWAARHTTVCLDSILEFYALLEEMHGLL